MNREPYDPINWNGIQVLKNDLLTGRTMVVSPEVYEMLTETPEQRQAKARALVEKADQLMALCNRLTGGRGVATNYGPRGQCRIHGCEDPATAPNGTCSGHCYD
jgi:hypothetical protein